MPFKSDKQRKWMHANEPEMAKKWEKEESINEANASVIRKKLLKQFGDDPLYKDFIIAKTPKEQKKALKTLKSIRGFNAVRLMQKYVKKLQDESVNESDLGLTYKRGKTVKVTHKKSGKELIIIDKPNVKKEYEKIGYFAEGQVNEISMKMQPFSSQEARYHINSDIKDMSKHLGKASQQVIKIMMDGVRKGKYTAMDISRGIKEGPAQRTHFGEMTFIQSLWNKMREKFRRYSKDGKLS